MFVIMNNIIVAFENDKNFSMKINNENCDKSKAKNRKKKFEQMKSSIKLIEFCVFDRKNNENFVLNFMLIDIFCEFFVL